MVQSILIVEDEIADTIKYALEIECFSVATGTGAIRTLMASRIGLTLTIDPKLL